MRKILFALIFVAFCVVCVAAGEGDRRYDNFYSEQVVVGAQENIIVPWSSSWRYTLVVSAGAALADSSRITFTYDDGDTALVRFRGGLTAASIVVIPFYGPPVCTLRVKCYGTNSHVTALFWK